MDPREYGIRERLLGVKRIIAVSSSKGGVGKSSISSVLALCLSKKGLKTGLLDLDFYGPSISTILGLSGLFPEEDKGIVPPKRHGVSCMSMSFFLGDRPAPLRGEEVTDSIIELLTITQWGELDILVIDMPPGIGDATLEVLRLMPETRFIVVSTPSKVVRQVVKRLIATLDSRGVKVLGVVENMSKRRENDISYPVIAKIGFDPKLEEALGDPDLLLNTDFARQIGKIAHNL